MTFYIIYIISYNYVISTQANRNCPLVRVYTISQISQIADEFHLISFSEIRKKNQGFRKSYILLITNYVDTWNQSHCLSSLKYVFEYYCTTINGVRGWSKLNFSSAKLERILMIIWKFSSWSTQRNVKKICSIIHVHM